MSDEVLLEYEANIEIAPSALSVRSILNATITDVFDTVISFDVGRVELSAGNAEAKSQSSSVPVEAPLLCCGALGVAGTEAPGDAKLNIEGDGAGEGCWGGLDARAAKGSSEDVWAWENAGPGVLDRDVG